MFTQEIECPLCKQLRELAEEVGAFSNKIKVEAYDFVKKNEKAKEYQIDKVPAIAVLRKKDWKIRFCGLAYGCEFRPLTESITNVSRELQIFLRKRKRSLCPLKSRCTFKSLSR